MIEFSGPIFLDFLFTAFQNLAETPIESVRKEI